MNCRPPRRRCGSKRGFSHVEVLVSTLIVGGMMVTGMNLLGAVVKSRTLTSNRARGALYAHEMICEVASRDYLDDDSPTFGPEDGESTGTRWLFDDADDYHGWTETPLRGWNLSVIANTTGWQRTVSVAWVDPASPSTS